MTAKRKRKTKRAPGVERVARWLWDEHRFEMLRGGTIPAYHTYADGAQEPCVWAEQDAELHRYFYRQARRVLRIVRGRPGERPAHD